MSTHLPTPQTAASSSPEAQAVPPILAELSPQQFQEWRRHPVTDLVLRRFLPDFRRSLERNAINGWLANKVVLSLEQELRGRIVTLYELEELALPQIRQFYDVATPEDLRSTPARGRPFSY